MWPLQRSSLTILGACILATSIHANAEGRAGDSIYAACQGCHGAQGEGNPLMNAPTITHLDAAYLKRQLKNFKAGLRGSDARDTTGAPMRAVALTLESDNDIDAVVSHITSLPTAKPAATFKGNIDNGRDYFSMVCGGCHGPKAEGNDALNAPRLAGTNDWYLLRQFENFRSGVRGAHPDDRFGAQMKAMTRALPTEQAVRDVIAYINTLAQ